MTVMTRIQLAKDFSAFPFGRYAEHGPFNGERFRREFLLPPLRAGEAVEVDLDGARGLSPSFLEEAFGGLLREGFNVADVLRRVTIVSDRDPSFVSQIQDYMRAAGAR
jgi:hypothetical protein